MQDKTDLQKDIGSSESNTNDEKIYDKINLATMGESKALAETDSCRTDIVEEKLCSAIQDKTNFQKNVGLNDTVASDDNISGAINSTNMGESETCLEAEVFRTAELDGEVGLSESDTNGETISDAKNLTMIGESEKCHEAGIFVTAEAAGKLCGKVQDEMNIQKSVGLNETVASDEKTCDEKNITTKKNITTRDESETCVMAGILRTAEVDGNLCCKMQDSMDLKKSFRLSESDANGEVISDETNHVTVMDQSEMCFEMNEEKCKKTESSGQQILKGVVQTVGVLCNDSEKQRSGYVPVSVGGNATEVHCMTSTGSEKTCITKVSVTSTANSCQKATSNLNGGLPSEKTSEINRSVNNCSTSASRIIVIKNKDDFTVSRSSETASNKTFRSVAKLLHDVGLGLVTEWVCQDLIYMQTQTTISRLSETEKNRQLSVLAANRQRLAKKNKAFAFQNRQCMCGFWSESRIVLAFHSQFGDVSRNGDMHCCLCTFTALKPRYFIRHLKRRHKLKALGTVKVAQHQCHFCPFENNHQVRLESHLAKCCKLFDLNCNLAPVRMECDIPIFVAPKPLLTDDMQAMLGTVTCAATSANQAFQIGGKPPQMPLRSSMPSCSLIIQPPQQCATIPSSVALSLPLAHFVVTPSVSHGSIMSQLQLSVVPPRNSAQPCSVVSPLVTPSLLPVVAPGQLRVMPTATPNSLRANLISHSQRGLVLPTNLAQNLSQTGINIPPLVGKDAPQSLLGVSPSVTMVQPERCLLFPRGFGSDLLRMQLLASQTPTVQFQNHRSISGAETRFFQVGNQICTIVQHQGRSILTPVIFPPPILPFAPSSALNLPAPTKPIVSFGRQSVVQNSAQMSPFVVSSNVLMRGDAVSFVRTPRLPPSTDTNRLSLNLEICELCDGFVKDRQSLSVHFRNAHRVGLDDPNCLVPSHSCSLCTKSFYSISGLLRHYHLVHASDSRLIMTLKCCSLCQQLNLKNAVEHLSSAHRDVMSMSREFKHCGICSLPLRDIQSFERHMLLFHGNIFANRNILLTTIAASLIDKTRPLCESNPSGLYGNLNEGSNKLGKTSHTCKTCGTTHVTAEELNSHIVTNHMHKCSRCQESFNSLPSLRRHFHVKHSTEREACPLCLKTVQIGRPFIRHMKSQHLKDCSVNIERIRNSDMHGNPAKRKNIYSVNVANSYLKETSNPVENGKLNYDEDMSSHSAKRLKLESDQLGQE